MMMNNYLTAERWLMSRAVLFNFWYYPDQELVFRDGCAVLRGHNGSGKSVTTQSLITVLLDGDTRPHKLDPFGGRERKISDTVLGEEELTGHMRRIGYLALEFRKNESNEVKTIGIGIDANREKKHSNTWFFIFDKKTIGNSEDNVRLFKKDIVDGKAEKLPLNEKELRNEIEINWNCGKVYSKKEEYATQVNNQIFGFETLEGFNSLINLLLQIRSPKLSDNARPEGVVEVLNASLPQLSDEELRPLTSSIESIDRLEKDLQKYKDDLKSIERLKGVFDAYQELATTDKADAFLKSVRKLEESKRDLEKNKKNLEHQKDAYQQSEQTLRSLEAELVDLREEKDNLGFEEIDQLQGKLIAQRDDRLKVEQRMYDLEEKVSKTKQRRLAEISRIDKQEVALSQAEKELRQSSFEMEDLVSEMDFESHTRFYDHFKNNISDDCYSFESWRSVLKEYSKFIKATLECLNEHEQLNSLLLTFKNTAGELEQKMHEAEQIIAQLETERRGCLRNISEAIEQWAYQNTVLILPRELTLQLQRQLDNVFDDLEKDEYFSSLSEFVEEKMNFYQTEISMLKAKISAQRETVSTLEDELDSWKNDREFDPPFVSSKKKDWQQLDEEGISYRPFYEVFEFRSNLSEKEQLWLQSALHESGILSSVIVDKKDAEKASEFTAVLNIEPEKGMNLSSILKPVNDDEELRKILEGIAFESTGSSYVLKNGQFSTNFVRGKASFYDENLYIGKEAREKNRLKKIQELESLIASENATLEQLSDLLTKNETEKATIKSERGNFPSIDVLRQIIRKIDDDNSKIHNVLKPELEKVNELIHVRIHEMKVIMIGIKQKMELSNLQLTSISFQSELNRIEEYLEILNELISTYKDMVVARKEVIRGKEQIQNYDEELENQREDLADFTTQEESLARKISALEKQLAEMGSEEIIQRLNQLKLRIEKEIPSEERRTWVEKTKIENEMTKLEIAIELATNNTIPFLIVVVDAWEMHLLELFRIDAVEMDIELESTIEEKATFLVRKNGSRLDKHREAIDKAKGKLYKLFQNQKVELLHYDLDLSEVTPSYFADIKTLTEKEQDEMNFIKSRMARIDVTLNVYDRRMSLKRAVETLRGKIEEVELLATTEDRKLFEEILINTLGDSIRRKIQDVENWEKEMNKYMEHENIIKFRIKWVPKSAEKDGEIHTRRLVELLKKEARWIDLSEISKHFRSKISDVKRRQSRESEVNLQKEMREILDYRNWFDFEIYFTKYSGREQRLTKRTYGELSGGQRVLAMVTPVLAALYAKYSDAREDAPMIFTLDEAFSRVDEVNINVMFTYIHKLGFNYILNSQGLWGCFESVPSLNIYELSRPNNIPVVSVESYYWNGQKRVKIDEEKVTHKGELITT